MARIYKRKKVYYADLFIRGKRVRKALATDKQIAQEKLADLVKDRQSSRYSHADTTARWDRFTERYLAWAVTTKNPKTVEIERSIIKTVNNVISPVLVSDVGIEQTEHLKAKWIANGLAPHTINRYLRCIKTILRTAEDWQMAPALQLRRIRQVKEPKGRLRFLTKSELNYLIKRLNGTLRSCVYLGALAGLRRGEMATLEWNDCDLDRGRINIAPKPDWMPKDAERRHIPMTKGLRNYLARLKLTATSPWVIGNWHPNRKYLNLLSCQFRRAASRLGMKGVTIHTLRHTFGSHLAMGGVPLYTIAKMMGHSNTKTTEIYAHLSPETYDTAINTLPDL